MATPFSSNCPDCGGASSTTYGQQFLDRGLVWSESTSCSNCGYALEADADGFPPLQIRNWLIENHGRWALSVNTTGAERLKPCKILHCDLNTTLDEVKTMKDRMPGIVYTGTQREMDWLCTRVCQFDFDGSITQVDDNTEMRGIDVSLAEIYPR